MPSWQLWGTNWTVKKTSSGYSSKHVLKYLERAIPSTKRLRVYSRKFLKTITYKQITTTMPKVVKYRNSHKLKRREKIQPKMPLYRLLQLKKKLMLLLLSFNQRKVEMEHPKSLQLIPSLLLLKRTKLLVRMEYALLHPIKVKVN